MGRADLIGNGKHHLIPSFQPATAPARAPRPSPRAAVLTQHTRLPPRKTK